jgi:hypothetical protein
MLLLMAGAAAQAQVAADICYGPAQPASGATPPTSSTVFTCPQAGNKTVAQLAAAGWSLVKLAPTMLDSVNSAAQLTIQRKDRLFRNGFQ